MTKQISAHFYWGRPALGFTRDFYCAPTWFYFYGCTCKRRRARNAFRSEVLYWTREWELMILVRLLCGCPGPGVGERSVGFDTRRIYGQSPTCVSQETGHCMYVACLLTCMRASCVCFCVATCHNTCDTNTARFDTMLHGQSSCTVRILSTLSGIGDPTMTTTTRSRHSCVSGFISEHTSARSYM